MNTKEIIQIIETVDDNLRPLIKNSINYLEAKIKSYDSLSHLFLNDPEQNYFCSPKIKSKRFNHLQKCVILTREYDFMNEYIDYYLYLHPGTIDYQNDFGWTALILACRNASTCSTEETVRILIKHHADLNLQCEQNMTALMYACNNSASESSENVVRMLLEAGCNINLKNINGLTAIFYGIKTISKSTIGTLKLLLDFGADINSIDGDDGWTLLMFAIHLLDDQTTVETIQFLLERDVDIHLTDDEGWNAFMFATDKPLTENVEKIIKLIIEKMDDCNVFVGGQKMIKYAYDQEMSNEIISLINKKGGKKEDLFDESIFELVNMLV